MPCLNGEAASAFIFNPHFVRLMVPECGFGSELDAMVQFFQERGEELRVGCFRSEYIILFCFRERRNADEFARRFGGEIFVVPSDDDLFFP